MQYKVFEKISNLFQGIFTHHLLRARYQEYNLRKWIIPILCYEDNHVENHVVQSFTKFQPHSSDCVQQCIRHFHLDVLCYSNLNIQNQTFHFLPRNKNPSFFCSCSFFKKLLKLINQKLHIHLISLPLFYPSMQPFDSFFYPFSLSSYSKILMFLFLKYIYAFSHYHSRRSNFIARTEFQSWLIHLLDVCL